MITVTYEPNIGQSIRDGQVEAEFELILHQSAIMVQTWWQYSTENIFLRLRVGVKEGRIKPDEIEFLFVDANHVPWEIHVDHNGRSNDWPEGYLDLSHNLTGRLL